MATIYNLKSRFQSLLRPCTRALARAGITANQVTVSALILSLLSGVTIAAFPTQNWPLLALPFVLFIRMALNAIDGMLAREHNMKSAFGAMLNELGDVVSDSVIYLAFAFIAGISSIAIVLVVVFAILSEMAGVVAIQIGASRRYDGPMGKSDRAFWFGAAAIGIGLGVLPTEWINIGLWVIAALLLYTIYNRICNALKEVANAG